MNHIKEWLIKHKIMFLTTLILLGVPISAFAASLGGPAPESSLQDFMNQYPTSSGYSYYVESYDYNGTHWVQYLASKTALTYTGTTVTGLNSTPMLSQDGNGNWVVYYANSQNLSSVTNVNFTHPPTLVVQPVAKTAGVQSVIAGVLGVLQDGGLVSKGLAILAIMLGVSLVPRLTRLFLH